MKCYGAAGSILFFVVFISAIQYNYNLINNIYKKNEMRKDRHESCNL